MVARHEQQRRCGPVRRLARRWSDDQLGSAVVGALEWADRRWCRREAETRRERRGGDGAGVRRRGVVASWPDLRQRGFGEDEQ